MSLIGLRTLYQIESRCREIFANEIDEPFGGLIIYLFGDYNQIPAHVRMSTKLSVKSLFKFSFFSIF